jgi:hypothetical protein
MYEARTVVDRAVYSRLLHEVTMNLDKTSYKYVQLMWHEQLQLCSS